MLGRVRGASTALEAAHVVARRMVRIPIKEFRDIMSSTSVVDGVSKWK
jgi:hypothetical protein